ncbi:MAG: phosphate regulon sensor histidine kinase PhoR [Firmicutes bacterium]|nr:phosphate regulon sensor histidine kinase PhoR [Bacillota bacterium]
MFKSLKWKLSASFIALVLVSILVLGGYLIEVLERYFIEDLRGQLLTEARLVREMVAPAIDRSDRSTVMVQLAERLSRVTETRVTIIDADGVVLGDSQELASQMDNHLQRPEIQQALTEGIGISERESTTVKTRMMYVALPIEGPTGPKGFVRLALSLTEIHRALSRLWVMVITAFLFSAVLAAVIGLKLAERLTRPIQEMTLAAKRMAEGDFSLRTYTTHQDEVGVLGLALNRMAQQLKETIDEVSMGKSKLESVLASMVSGVIFVSGDGRIDLINPAAKKILGIERNVLVGRPQAEVIRNYDLSTLVSRVLKNREAVHEELLLLSPHEKTVEVNFTPIHGQGEQNLGVVVVLHDITEIRKLERMRADFVANVSHELKTPVTSLKGYAETLLDGALDDPETAREFVKIILNEAERLRLLIHDLLELSKIESKVDPVRMVSFNLSELLKNLAVKFKPQVEEKQVRFALVVPEPPVYALGDPDRIEQVMINLIDNAIKYTPPGGRVEVRVSERENDVLVEVVDTGIGIPEQDLSRIFERFYRVDKARSRKLGGTGLGLAIVKHILEAHNTQIQVESTLGQGSRFYFTLSKGNR